MRTAGRIALWTGWAASLVLALACFAVLLQGVLRDTRWGEPVIPLDFSQASGWKAETFRVWGEDRYALFFSSVSHDPELAGRHLTANFQVRILGPGGNVLLDHIYYGEYLDHVVPRGYGDTRLETLEIRGKPWNPGTLQVRVREPDPAFRTTRSELKLWRVRPDDGMGGLLNYAMMMPGAVLMLLALVFAGLLAARKAIWPLITTLSAAALVVALMGILGS